MEEDILNYSPIVMFRGDTLYLIYFYNIGNFPLWIFYESILRF